MTFCNQDFNLIPILILQILITEQQPASLETKVLIGWWMGTYGNLSRVENKYAKSLKEKLPLESALSVDRAFTNLQKDRYITSRRDQHSSGIRTIIKIPIFRACSERFLHGLNLIALSNHLYKRYWQLFWQQRGNRLARINQLLFREVCNISASETIFQLFLCSVLTEYRNISKIFKPSAQ